MDTDTTNIDPTDYSVYGSDSGHRYAGTPSVELVAESLRTDTGHVRAVRIGDDWLLADPDDTSVFRIYVERDDDGEDTTDTDTDTDDTDDTDTDEPTFAEVRRGLIPGIYSARRLNGPGKDWNLLVREDGWLSWVDRDGETEGYFSVEELCDLE